MPIAYRIDVARGLVFKHVTGRVTPEDLATHVRALSADPDFRPGFHAFADCREADLTVSSDEVRRMAGDVRASGRALGAGRCAILVASDVQFGMMRIFEAFIGDASMEFRTFRSAPEARRWLEEVTDAPIPLD